MDDIGRAVDLNALEYTPSDAASQEAWRAYEHKHAQLVSRSRLMRGIALEWAERCIRFSASAYEWLGCVVAPDDALRTLERASF